jgi:hypothetical protein
LHLILTSLLSVPVSEAPKLPSMPSKVEPIELKQWSDYSRTLLQIMFPTRLKLLRKMKIIVVENPDIFAKTDLEKVVISTGLIGLASDKDEFASVLSHEFAHRLLLHYVALKKIEADGSIVLDWDALRRNELESDFVSLAVSANQPSILSILQRVIPTQVEYLAKAPPQYRLESAQTLMLQQNSLERLLKMAAPQITSAEPIPGPLPRADATIEEWEKYTKKVLRAMYPTASSKIDRIGINISDTAWFIYADYDAEMITFAPALVRYVVKSKEEFAVLMGHEFAHFLFSDRAYFRDNENTSIVFPPLDLALRADIEADIAGTLPIVRGECRLANVLDRLFKVYGAEAMQEHRVRLSRLRTMCALNY